jgi:phosphomannomutase
MAVAAFGYFWDICFVDQPAVEGYKKASIEMQNEIEKAGGQVVKVLEDHYPGSSKKGNITLYYEPLITMGVLNEKSLEDKVVSLGSTMNDPAAVYAAIRLLLKDKIEAGEFTSYGNMTDELREVFEKARTEIFTRGLKMPAKFGIGPDKNHSYQQNIEGGKNMFFSTYFLPLQVVQPKNVNLLRGTPDFSDIMIKAQTLGTVQSMVNNKRKVVLITSDTTAQASVAEMDQFFKDVAGFLAADAASQTGLDDMTKDVIRGLRTLAADKEMLDAFLIRTYSDDYVERLEEGPLLDENDPFNLKEALEYAVDMLENDRPEAYDMLHEGYYGLLAHDLDFWQDPGQTSEIVMDAIGYYKKEYSAKNKKSTTAGRDGGSAQAKYSAGTESLAKRIATPGVVLAAAGLGLEWLTLSTIFIPFALPLDYLVGGVVGGISLMGTGMLFIGESVKADRDQRARSKAGTPKPGMLKKWILDPLEAPFNKAVKNLYKLYLKKQAGAKKDSGTQTRPEVKKDGGVQGQDTQPGMLYINDLLLNAQKERASLEKEPQVMQAKLEKNIQADLERYKDMPEQYQEALKKHQRMLENHKKLINKYQEMLEKNKKNDVYALIEISGYLASGINIKINSQGVRYVVREVRPEVLTGQIIPYLEGKATSGNPYIQEVIKTALRQIKYFAQDGGSIAAQAVDLARSNYAPTSDQIIARYVRDLTYPDAGVRSDAADGLAKLDKLTSELKIVRYVADLSDPMSHVRLAAVKGLGKIGDPQTIDILAAALKDDYVNVRLAAAEALGDMGDLRAVEYLQKAFSRFDPLDQSFVADALRRIIRKNMEKAGKDGGTIEFGPVAIEKILTEKQKEWTKFGTSGLRGKIGVKVSIDNKESEVLEDVIFPIAAQAIAMHGIEKLHKGYYLLGGDPRKGNTEKNIKMDASILAANGIRSVVFVDALGNPVVTPTPFLAFLAKSNMMGLLQVDGTINNTASHNPKDDNGKKFSEAHGGAAKKATTDNIQKYINRMLAQENLKIETMDYEKAKQLGLIKEIQLQEALDMYVKQYLIMRMKDSGKWDQIIKYARENPKFNLIINPMQGAGVEAWELLAKELEQAAGREFIRLINTQRDPDFSQVKNAPNPTEMSSIQGIYDEVKGDRNTMVLMTDGDADRFGIIDGKIIEANEFMAMYTYYYAMKILSRDFVDQKKTISFGKTVATSNMVNAVVDHINKLGREQYGATYDVAVLYERQVGYKWFVEDMEDKGIDYAAAGEESAHMGAKPFDESKDDGIAMSLLALAMRAETGMNLPDYLRMVERNIGAAFIYKRDTVKFDDVVPTEEEAKALKQKAIDLIKFTSEQKDTAYADMEIIKRLSDFGLTGQVKDVITDDGAKIVYKTGDWLLIRISGTENAARLYTEVTDISRQELFRTAGKKLLGVPQTSGKEDRSDENDDLSTYSRDGGISQAPEKTGGIDFRSLPVQAAAGSVVGPETAAAMPQVSLAEMNDQWKKILSTAQKGELPYQQMKQLVSCCKAKEEAAGLKQEVTAYVVNLLKCEEERAISTPAQLKEIVALVAA